MCIIAIYDKTHEPDRKTLERMIKKNPDGVGVAYNDGRDVHFIKGLTTADEVLEYYREARDECLQFVFHARIATSGGVSAEKCHPFTLSGNNALLNSTHATTRTPCVFHNGIFPITPDKGLNDTQTFIKHSLAPLHYRDGKALKYGKYDELLEKAVKGSRLVILYPDSIRTYGSWQAEDGVQYSNGGYKEPTFTRGSYYTAGGGYHYPTYPTASDYYRNARTRSIFELEDEDF